MRKLFIFASIFYLSLSTIHAQNNSDAIGAQLLYLTDEGVFLHDANTTITQELPYIEPDINRWEWSPDGNYLAITFHRIENDIAQLGIFDVYNLRWHYLTVIPENITTFSWSHDSQSLAISFYKKELNNAQLWIFNLHELETELVHETTSGSEVREMWIRDIEWSPNDDRLLFETQLAVMGGANIGISMIDPDNPDHLTLIHNAFYGNYSPIWSPDGTWLAINLELDYYCRTCPSAGDDGEYGDIYLFSVDGERIQLTFEPEIENSVQWSENAEELIIYAEDHTLTSAGIIRTVINFDDAIREGVTIYNSRSEVINLSPVTGYTDIAVSPDRLWRYNTECNYDLEPLPCILTISKIESGEMSVIAELIGSQYYRMMWRPYDPCE